MESDTIRRLKEALPPFIALSDLKRKTATESAGPCPLCGGTDRFYVRDGKAFCRQCRPKGGDIIDWHRWIDGLDLAGLLKKYCITSGNGKPKLVKTYDYTDTTGNLIFQVCRMEPKNFRQRRPDGKGGWQWNLQGITPVLYRMVEVIRADEVMICEGEKDADSLSELGFTATTCPMGAQKWREHYNEHLKGKRVVILPDNDDAGRKHLVQVARSLASAGIEARVVILPDGVKDVSDFVETFKDKSKAAERLAMMIDGAEPYKPIEEAAEKKDGPPTKVSLRITSEELAEAKLSPPCIVKNYLYGDVANLTAPGGTGKTTQSLYEMARIALGRPLYSLEVCRPGWSLYVTAEDSREILVARLREIMTAMDTGSEERQTVMDNVLIWDVAGEAFKLIEVRDGIIELTSLADEIVMAYESDPPVLVVFDPAISFGASENLVNDNEQGLITAGRRIVRGLGCCVRFVAHTGKANARNKTTDQYTSRGGSALPDGSRMTAVMQTWQPGNERKLPPGLTHSPESSITFLARPKLSYAPPNLPLIWIKRTGWAFEHVTETLVSDEEREKALLDQIERFIHSEVRAGRYHTKNTLESGRPDSVTRTELRQAVDQLIVRSRVVEMSLPEQMKHGGRKAYLTTADLAKCGEVG